MTINAPGLEAIFSKVSKSTISRKKRNILWNQFYKKIRINPLILDVMINYHQKNKSSYSDFMLKLNSLFDTLNEKLPGFIASREHEALNVAQAELIQFYKGKSDFGSEMLQNSYQIIICNQTANLIKRLNDAGKYVFEFSGVRKPSTYFKPKNFSNKKDQEDSTDLQIFSGNNRDYYDYRGIIEKADFLVLYHATSTTFLKEIKEHGILPANQAIPNYSEIYRKYMDKHDLCRNESGKFDEKKYEEFIKRFDYTYYSTSSGKSQDPAILMSNATIYKYLERAVELWGGKEKGYRAIIETSRLLPDEDSSSSNIIDSIYSMGSVKIHGALTDNLIPLGKKETNREFLYVIETYDKTPRANTLLSILNDRILTAQAYLEENPLT